MAPNRNQQNIVFLQSGDPETEARTAAGDSYIAEKGNLLTVVDPADSTSKQYRLVETDSVLDVAPAEGAVAYWKDRANYVVTTDVSVAGRGNVAGIFRRAVAVGELCCIQRRGNATVLAEDSPTAAPTAAGLIVIPGSNDGRADVLAAGSAATYPKIGVSTGTEDAAGLFTAALEVEDGMAEG